MSMRLTEADVGLLCCPACHGRLHFAGVTVRGGLERGVLACEACERTWPLADGLPRLLEERAVVGKDRLLRPIYDLISPFHDVAVDVVLPILQYPDPQASRDHYIARLELDHLRRPPDGRPLRILEVGIGGGANLPLIERELPDDLEVELWGIDLSVGMIRQCRRRLAWFPISRRVRLVLGDAHALPFPTATFDRVLHVGGINGYRDPGRGLAEMARVARGGTPIVVVDEALDPGRSHAFHHWLGFRAITIWDRDPRAPRNAVPPGAVNVEVTAVSRFYYCLAFRMPEPPAPVSLRKARRLGVAPGGATMGQVTGILTNQELMRIQNEYDPQEMLMILAGTLPSEYAPSKGYVDAIGDAFYGTLPPDDAPPPRDKLSLQDRERCTIALLASPDVDFALGLHIYVALANQVSPGEVAHVLLLAGVYRGIATFNAGLDTEILTLQTLKTLLSQGLATPGAVVQALRMAFRR